MPETSTNIQLPAIAILGAGSMGGAILTGLSQPTVSVDGGVQVTTAHEDSAARLRESGHHAVSTEREPEANLTAVKGAQVVVLGVKPAGIAALAGEIGDGLGPGAVVVSVAAGVRTSTIEAALPAGTAVVRAMPNTPATIGRGVTGVAAGSAVTAEQLDLVQGIFATVGTVHVVPETQIDALTAVSGSGPAYLFYFAEKLAEAGVSLGLDPALSEALAVETVRGAGELLASSDLGAGELRRRVTSPRGTTEQAISVLEREGLAEMLAGATRAASARAAELAAELAGDATA